MTVTAEQRQALQRAAKNLAAASAERDKLVISAYQEGASLREIADLLGVNHVTVRNIIQRNRQAEP